MINWETLQIQKIPMLASDRNSAIIGMTLSMLVILACSWMIYQLDSGKENRRFVARFFTCMTLACGFLFVYAFWGNPYYKASVEVEKMAGIEKKLLDVEEDKAHIKLTDGYVTMPEGKDDVFKPYLDCVLDGEVIRVSSLIQKKDLEDFESIQEFKSSIAEHINKQLDFVRDYKKHSVVEKEKEDFNKYVESVTM